MNAKMPELKACFESAGFLNVRTVLSSGNVAFGSALTDQAAIESLAEEAMKRRLARSFYSVVRSPFAKTMSERLANADPRLSLEERYGTHDGYVDAVRNAAANAVASGFLLQADADALIAQADASKVLVPREAEPERTPPRNRAGGVRQMPDRFGSRSVREGKGAFRATSGRWHPRGNPRALRGT